MRIAFIAPLDAPLCGATARGPHVIVTDLARGLRARGHDVMVFCAQGSYLADVDTAPVLSGSGYDELLWHVARWMPDVVSLHAPAAEAPVLASGIPYVHTLHANPPAPLSARTRPAHGAIVAVSRDSARRWRAAGVTDLRTIAHGVPDRDGDVSPPEPVALIAGRIAPEKGVSAALRVAARAGLEAILVGEVCDRGYFAREIVPLLARVHVFRTLPRERVRALMARAAVTLVPAAFDEPFGLVAAEAQTAGCPVAGYARGALPEIVSPDAGVLVASGDEDALVGAIATARSLDRAAIRERARSRFDLGAMIDAHEELLAEVATGVVRANAAA